MVGCGGLLATAGLQEEQMVTWFQFHSYLQRQDVSDLEKHLTQLTKEGRAWPRPGSRSQLTLGALPLLAWATMQMACNSPSSCQS